MFGSVIETVSTVHPPTLDAKITMREVTEPPSYLLIDSADESERDSEGDLILAVKDIKQEDGATLLLCKTPKLEWVWHSYKEVALELSYLFIHNYA